MLIEIRKSLQRVANSEKALLLERYFKTGKGEYAEGDQFIGVTVPDLRRIVRASRECPLSDVERLISSPIHEERFIGLQLLVHSFESGDESSRKLVYKRYTRLLRFVNNWDLVDGTAPYIVGGYLFNKEKDALYTLAKSKNLWKRRIAIIATLYFIRKGAYDDTLTIATLLLHDSHDLIHKAAGWMLREVGKRNMAKEVNFLQAHAHEMPRTMLRYAIEKFPERQRKRFLTQTHSQ